MQCMFGDGSLCGVTNSVQCLQEKEKRKKRANLHYRRIAGSILEPNQAISYGAFTRLGMRSA